MIEFVGCGSLFFECEKWFIGLSIACCKFHLRIYCQWMRQMHVWLQQQLHVSAPFVVHILCQYYYSMCSLLVLLCTCDVICYVEFVFRLQCERSEHKPTNWSVCPSAQCSSNVFIGNITSHIDSCNRTICAYTGYTPRNISAELVTQNTCAG